MHLMKNLRHMKLLLVFITFLALGYRTHAQCDHCSLTNEKKADFCYQDELFDGYCAAFSASQSTFQLLKGKKTLVVPLANPESKSELIDLAKDKKLKLSGLDMIFIVNALRAWEKAERDVGMDYTETGLGIKIIKQGEGPLVKDGQLVTVHYTGSLENGSKFDSSYDRGQPISFTAGQGRVIKGWDEAITKLNVGTIALLKIPANLAYGSRGAGKVIPPDAILYFEIEVISIQ